MVDENELAGKVTPVVAMENINVGCDILEAGFKKVGKDGTWEQFNEAIGRVVSADTTRHDGPLISPRWRNQNLPRTAGM